MKDAVMFIIGLTLILASVIAAAKNCPGLAVISLMILTFIILITPTKSDS